MQFTNTEIADISLAIENYQDLWANYERECRNRGDKEGAEKAREYYRVLSDIRRKVNKGYNYRVA